MQSDDIDHIAGTDIKIFRQSSSVNVLHYPLKSYLQ